MIFSRNQLEISGSIDEEGDSLSSIANVYIYTQHASVPLSIGMNIQLKYPPSEIAFAVTCQSALHFAFAVAVACQSLL